MAPVVLAMRADGRFQPIVCLTGQHREMLDAALSIFHIEPDMNLALMRPDQAVNQVISGVFDKLDPILFEVKPDYVLVQGDTATSMAAAVTAFMRGIRVGHVEAGLRTGNLSSPWPEEANRRLTAVVTSRHFAPTRRAGDALIKEGHSPESIVVTGNTVIDALEIVRHQVAADGPLRQSLDQEFCWLGANRRMILITGHRRESFGSGFRSMCLAMRDIASREDVEIVYPVHLNPNVRAPVNEILAGCPRVHLIEPLDYRRFVYLMMRCHFILTDSGGIQEEAPYLGKPVLVMRDTSERMEAIEAGVARLVTNDRQKIFVNASELLDIPASYAAMANGASPFGDGLASQRILADLASEQPRDPSQSSKLGLSPPGT
jgi:UDP-N-acetylglucosamine 2-epimerase (non-hydrolysing)